MVARRYRPLVIGLLPIALMACMSSGSTVAEEGAPVPLGIDLGRSGPVIAKSDPPAPARGTRAEEGYAAPPQNSGEMQMAHAGHNNAFVFGVRLWL